VRRKEDVLVPPWGQRKSLGKPHNMETCSETGARVKPDEVTDVVDTMMFL